jgi:hypothetical protein
MAREAAQKVNARNPQQEENRRENTLDSYRPSKEGHGDLSSLT